MSYKLKSIAFAAAISAFAGAAAQAQTIDRAPQSQTVLFADLNLSSEAGMKTLMTRINGAAKNVCGPAPDDREWHMAYQACIKSAAETALIQVAHATGANQLAVNVRRQPGG